MVSEVIPESSPMKPNKFGVLLVNLGTPEAPTAGAVRTYLREFLSDPRVIDAPKLVWFLVLNCIVLVVRPAKVAKLYQSVWTENGSPLYAIGKQQINALQEVLLERFTGRAETVLAMTYGQPSVKSGLK